MQKINLLIEKFLLMKRLICYSFKCLLILIISTSVFCQSNPLILTNWNERYDFESIKPEYIQSYSKNIENLTNKFIATYFSEPYPDLNAKNTLYAFDSLLEIDYSGVINLLLDLHPDSLIRQSSAKAKIKLDSLELTIFQNENIYKRLKAFNESKSVSKIHPKHQKVLNDYIEEFEKNGVQLKGKNKKEFTKNSNLLFAEEQKFLNNIYSKLDTIWATKVQLEGMGDEYFDSHTYNDSLFYISLPSMDIFNAMTNAVQPEIRKEIFYANRYIDFDANMELMNRILVLRQKQAKLLGYSNYASLILKNNIINTSIDLKEFLDTLSFKMKMYLDNEKSHLIAINNNKPVNAWDFMYVRKVERENLGYRESELMQFLPYETVFNGFKEITSIIYGIEYKKVLNPSVWNNDVELYDIVKDNKIIGSIYFDLYYRVGKPGVGAGLYNCVLPRIKEGTNRKAQLALVCSFPKQGNATLTPYMVSTLAHEWGHAMQFLFGEEDIHTVGFNTEFIEIPSSLMETIIWDPEISPFITKHFKTEAPISSEMAVQMKHKAMLEDFDILTYLLEVSSWDYLLHAHKEKYFDYHKMSESIWPSIYPYPNPDTSKHPMPSIEFIALPHYASQYYGYILSKMFAIDLLSQFKKEGVLNQETWNRYRETLLAPGNLETPQSMLYNFLGREPSQEAFYKYFGLDK